MPGDFLMSDHVDPKKFGLSSRTVIEKSSAHHFFIVLIRKSRIVMSDGIKLLNKINKMKQVDGSMKVRIKTTAPVCSKTRVFLKKHDIDIVN
jgi:hypothetical protein